MFGHACEITVCTWVRLHRVNFRQNHFLLPGTETWIRKSIKMLSNEICPEIKWGDFNVFFFALITNLKSVLRYHLTDWGAGTFRKESICRRQVYRLARQIDHNKNLFIRQCYDTTRVLRSRTQHMVRNVSIIFVSSVDFVPWRSSAVRDSQRLCLQVTHLLFWEIVFALFTEIMNQSVTVLIYT
jgi:hypothetical protein